MVFATFDDEPRQFLVAAVLRPGNAPATLGVQGVVRRLIPKLWTAFPRARVRVRMDGGFATPAMFDELEAAGVEYVVAMAKNAVLEAAAAPLLADARLVAETTGASARLFGETRYQAGTWPHPRRAVIKAEVVVHPGRELRDNPRIVRLSAVPVGAQRGARTHLGCRLGAAIQKYRPRPGRASKAFQRWID
jgi:hypothetical protein